MSVAEVLTDAVGLLENGRAKGKFATDSEGKYVLTNAPEAVHFCAVGALWRASGGGEMYRAVYDSLLRASGSLLPLTDWSDLATDQEIRDAFERAIDNEYELEEV